MIGIIRTTIPGSSVAAGAAATAAQALFFTAVSVMMLIGVAVLLPSVVSKGSPLGRDRRLLRVVPRPDSSRRCRGDRDPHRSLAAVEAVAPRAMAQREAGSCHLQRLASLREGGGASVRRLVLLPHRRQRRLHGRLRHPGDRVHRRAVASSHMLSGLFAITPGGVGQTQALDVATLGRHAPTDNVAAFSVTQDSILMMWNVVPRRRAHALGLRLHTAQAAALEDTPEAGAGARRHLNESLPRPGSRRGLCP
jgi:hypothetical protein